MNIIIKCPVCKASNTVTIEQKACRRCTTDLTMLYNIKIHSYKRRFEAIQALLNKDLRTASISVKKAVRLSAEI